MLDPTGRDLLRLTLIPGLGPVLIARILEHFDSPADALRAHPAQLQEIRRIGAATARAVADAAPQTDRLADDELALADSLRVRIIPITSPDYPQLLRETPDPPPILYIRGDIDHERSDRYPVAIVGSRDCTLYGAQQAERFGLGLAQAGLTVVSGGALGIDAAAHRGALRISSGRTIAVLGCGLVHRYPPENRELLDSIADGRGCLVSELPLSAPPEAKNFPARNRIISGLSLGTLVIEAGRRSGALITARTAAEDQGREVFAVPGRVDSPPSEGTLNLLKIGGAHLVTHPSDVIAALESPAHHLFRGSHADRFVPQHNGTDAADPRPAPVSPPPATPAQQAVLDALDEPLTIDELGRRLSRPPAELLATITVLEISRRLRRVGPRLAKV